MSTDTLNRLSPKTASRALEETLPSPEGGKPFQTLTTGETVRSIHGTAYTRLWNDELLEAVAESAPDFTAPQKAAGGGTGLYCGEQDLFCFLIEPTGWAEIDGEAFAPGFFVWNSEVGRRSLGVQTFWFQAVCANHIVWDAAEIVSFPTSTPRMSAMGWWKSGALPTGWSLCAISVVTASCRSCGGRPLSGSVIRPTT